LRQPAFDKEMKKHSERRKHCALAENFRPPDPLLGGAGQPKINQLDTTFTFSYKANLVRIMHAISSYRGNRLTHTHTNRHDRLQYAAPQLARSVISIHFTFGKCLLTILREPLSVLRNILALLKANFMCSLVHCL